MKRTGSSSTRRRYGRSSSVTAARLAGLRKSERSAEEVQRQARVDDVLDEQDVTSLERRVDVLQEPDGAVLSAGVRRELDHVERVRNPKRAREIGEEDDARLERRDEDRIEAVVRGGDLGAELGDARGDLLPRQMHGADDAVLGCRCARHYEASCSR